MGSGYGRQYSDSTWRSGHPNWNGNYYFNDGNYYFDAGFAYPAIVSNEWDIIATSSGGIEFADQLGNDPTLFFSGSTGAFYSDGEFDSDRYGDGEERMRYAYFNRPYFWRNGSRFDRINVVDGGQRGYEFRRH